MTQLSTDQINKIKGLSTLISRFYRWDFKLCDNEVLLKIQTDEWLTLIISVSPKEIKSSWQIGNKSYKNIFERAFLYLLKNNHHALFEKQIISYLKRVIDQ